jgi:RNA polymerase sigma-70 factor (ECF subfamily)
MPLSRFSPDDYAGCEASCASLPGAGILDLELVEAAETEAPAPRRVSSPRFQTDALNDLCLAWLARMAKGDAKALEALYDATLPRLWALALKILRHPCDAQDVLSEVYLQIWRDAATHAPERGAPITWMTMICRSRAIDYLRRRDPSHLRDDIDRLVDAQSTPPVFDDPESFALARCGHADPMHSVAWREQCRSLESALAALPNADRQLIVLAYYRGLSQSELAHTLGLPLGTVKSRTRRAFMELRRQLTLELM